MENLENKKRKRNKEKVIFNRKNVCDNCHNFNNKTSNFGELHFCKQCWKEILRNYRKNKKAKKLDIILLPKYGFIATYYWDRNILININNIRNTYTNELVKTLSYEFIHHILYRLVGLKTCYQFDNLKQESDVYNAGVEYEE